MSRRREAGDDFLTFIKTLELMAVGITAAASEAMSEIVRIEILNGSRFHILLPGCNATLPRLIIDSALIDPLFVGHR